MLLHGIPVLHYWQHYWHAGLICDAGWQIVNISSVEWSFSPE